MASILLTGAAQACPVPVPEVGIVVAGHPLSVALAASDDAIRCGLSNRDELREDQGMLFRFDRDVRHPFWMRDTRVALDIAFIDGRGTVLAIRQMTPLSEQLHYPPAPYRFALEMPAGWFARQGIQAGARVQFASQL